MSHIAFTPYKRKAEMDVDNEGPSNRPVPPCGSTHQIIGRQVLQLEFQNQASLYLPAATDHDISILAEKIHTGCLPLLREVDLTYSKITDQALHYLSGCEQLTSLNFSCCSITDEGLKTLGRLPNLQLLNVLHCPQITWPGFKELLSNRASNFTWRAYLTAL